MIGEITDDTIDEFTNRMENVMLDEEDAESFIEDVEEALRDIEIEMEGLTKRETGPAARLRSYKYMLKEMKSTAESMRI